MAIYFDAMRPKRCKQWLILGMGLTSLLEDPSLDNAELIEAIRIFSLEWSFFKFNAEVSFHGPDDGLE